MSVVRFVVSRHRGVRPVAAPQQLLGMAPHQLPRHGADVSIVRRTTARSDVGPRQLHPGTAAVQQPTQHGEGRRVHPFRLGHMTQVIDHQSRRQALQAAFEFHQLVARSDHLDVPAPFVHPCGQGLKIRQIGAAIAEIEADTAHPGLMQLLQFGIRDGPVDDRHTPGLPSAARQAIEQATIVGAIGGRRDDHQALQPQQRLQLAVVVQRGIGR